MRRFPDDLTHSRSVNRLRRRTSCVVAVAGLGASLMLVPTAAAAATPPAAPPSAATTPVPAAMLTALTRDLKLTPGEAASQARTQRDASRAEAVIKRRLGTTFGGAWFGGRSPGLTVGVTSMAQASWIRSLGAQPVLVKRSEAQLHAAVSTMDKAAAVKTKGIAAPVKDVTSWYADVAHNDVIVTASSAAAANSFVTAAGVDPASVRVVVSADRFSKTSGMRGGDSTFIDNRWACSIGFQVRGALVNDNGFLTAGHCVHPGSTTVGYDGTFQGTVVTSAFPGFDYGIVAASPNWTGTGMVNTYGGPDVSVDGVQELGIGSTVCRSGRASGYHCGLIEAKDVSVILETGEVMHHLTRNTVCGEPGDSGGPFVSWNQGQGLASAASGNCITGGHTLYQPLAPVLAQYGLTLKPPIGTGRSGVGIYGPLVPSRCIETAGGNSADNTPVQIGDCNGLDHQSWTFSTTSELRVFGTKCLGTRNGANGQGTGTVITTCNGSANQQWVATPDGRIVHAGSGLCLDLWKKSTSNGSGIAIGYCVGGTNQVWWSY